MKKLALLAALFITLVSVSAAGAATPTVNLASAASYSVLAGTPSVANTGPSTLSGDVGIHPASSVIGFPPGIVGGTIHAGDSVALQAKSDLTAAYLDAAGRPVTATHASLGGLTLVSGVYNAGGAVLDLTGTLTLDGQGNTNSVWIFQATSSLITASSSSVSLINGASPCNIFWQVSTSASLGSGSTFVGTIMASDSITLANGVSVDGRALAQNGLVSLINDTFINSPCSVAPPVIIPPTRPPYTPGLTATPIPSPMTTYTPAPSATPAATPKHTVAPTVTSSPPAKTPTVVAPTSTPKSNLPSSSTNEPVSPVVLLGVAFLIIGVTLLVIATNRTKA